MAENKYGDQAKSMNSSVAKVQHYVPRFLLRNFGTGKKDKLYVFDKQTERIFTTNVKNIAAESRFMTLI
jgi:hypothetical protein